MNFIKNFYSSYPQIRFKQLLKLPLFLLPFLCCRNKPDKEMCFVEISNSRGFVSPVTLMLNITDTVSPHQMDICARLLDFKVAEKEVIPIILRAESPMGNYGYDTLRLPLDIGAHNSMFYNRRNGYITVSLPYRKNILFRECGVWRFSLLPYIPYNEVDANRKIHKNITGLGISCKKENR